MLKRGLLREIHDFVGGEGMVRTVLGFEEDGSGLKATQTVPLAFVYIEHYPADTKSKIRF